MRICVVGGGIAGTMLAWRLIRHAGVDVDLITGPDGADDATRASGGLVRAFDPDPALAELATRSLRELRASALLRQWSGYQETGSLYLRAEPATGPRHPRTPTPDAAELLDRHALAARYGLTGLPEHTTAVLEHHAGYFSPDLLRRGARADFTARGGHLDHGVLREIRPGPAGVAYRTNQGWANADAVVLAAGAWTGRLLTDCDLPPIGVRTKVIQCAVYATGTGRNTGTGTDTGTDTGTGRHPLPAFVDETSGLYGRPAGPGRMLLGLPTQRWDVPPGPQPFMDREERAVRRALAQRLPGLQINPPHRFVAVAEAYVPEGRLELRPVPGHHPALFTFTGGSGGAAKTALAAGAGAAADLLGHLGQPGHPAVRPSTHPNTEDTRPTPIPEGERR
ncbi:FAD-dependent oxidoreductase [Kitasatospora sp. MAP5-34]|uniref:NAD(P)/FAD-dependent oxidoreductase n=1 Tax=Kitasatospora sp. MAP5-34 TaxID=3035102 RepID=UPI002476670C|nr:FAD-dependent oxidoreductase [Kitasatospora sp. MAP5-34]MDH6580630.1 glycine/D-amino acid oxidase-like deaminating enzyme [Kitasatospora sp. MAP5-34]